MSAAGVIAVALASLAVVLGAEWLVDRITRALHRARRRPAETRWVGRWFEGSMPWPARRAAPAPVPESQSDIGSGAAPGPRA